MKLRFAGLSGRSRTALSAGTCCLALALAGQARAQAAGQQQSEDQMEMAQPAGENQIEMAQPAPEMAGPAPEDTASPAGEAPAADGNEIVVTATKRQQTLQNVPVAVTVTTAATIERAQIRDLQDLSSVVPSLRVTQLQSSANTNFIIRGFGNGANNAGIEPSVGVFVDGVYRSRSAAQIADFPDVERIEVLRGPQSTLFGKNASAGVISIVTQAPRFRFGGNAEATYGNYDGAVVKGTVTGPVAGNLALRLSGGLNRRDGYDRDLGTGNRTNERDRWFLRGQALWDANDQLTVRIIGDYGEIHENCCGVVNLQPSAATAIVRALGGNVNAPGEIFANKVYDNFDSTNDIRNWGLSAQADYEFGPLTFTSITAYRRTAAKTDQDSDFTSADLIGRNYQDLRIRTFTQEFRVATNFEGPMGALFGAYYFNEHIDQANQLLYGSQFRPYGDALIQGASGGALSLAQLEAAFGGLEGDPAKYAGAFFRAGDGMTERYSMKDEAFSVFGQIDISPIRHLKLTGGLNYTHDGKRYSTNVTSNDVFSAIDLDATAYAPLRYGLLYAGALAQGLGAGAAGQYAAANANNPAVNPLAPLKAFQFLPPFLNVPNAVEPGRTEDGKITWIARAAYDVGKHVNVYLSYATGFKASSINLSRDSRPSVSDAAALTAAGLIPAQTCYNPYVGGLGGPNTFCYGPKQSYGSRFAGPENSTVWELGLKADWGVVTLNLAAFDQTIKGFQSNVFTGTGFVLTNAGKEAVKGFEVEGTVRPVRQLMLGLSLTYLDPRYDDFKISSVGDLSGTRPAGIPSISATWSASWDQPIGSNHLILSGDYHYESPVQIVEGLPGFLSGGTAAAIAAARPFRREVHQLDASATFAMANGVEVSVWGRNLTDDRYLVSIFDSVAQPGSISGYTSQPRTYGATLRYKW